MFRSDRIAITAAVALLLVNPARAWADDTDVADDDAAGQYANMSLEELLTQVVVATKVEQPIEEAPAIVDVITYQDIRRRGYRTVGEALQHVAGLFVIDDNVDVDVGVRGVFSSSGAANEILKVMLNNQSIAFRPTAGASLGYDLVPIEAIERIEIMRGPGSALYGANAFLGVVNIVTFRGSADEAGRRPHHSAALDGSLVANPHATNLNGTASVMSAQEFGGFRYLLTGQIHRGDRSGLRTPIGAGGYPSPGWDIPTRMFMQANAVTRGDTELRGSFYGLASYNLPSKFALLADGNFQYSDRHAEFVDYSFLNPATRLTQVNGFARLRLTYGAAEPKGLSGTLSVAMSSGSPTDSEHISDRLLDGAFKRRRLSSRALDLVAEGRYAFDPTNSLTLGLDYTYDLEDLLTMQLVNARTDIATNEPGFGKHSFVNVGAYLQWVWNPWRKLTFTLGARADHNSMVACDAGTWSCLGHLANQRVPLQDSSGQTDDAVIRDRGAVQLSSRAAVVYPFSVHHAYVKLTYGTSFKPPSPFQLYHRELTLTGSSEGNSTLKPQTASTVEAAFGITPLPGLKTSLVGFRTDIKSLVTFLKQGEALEGRNANLVVTGLEASVGYDWSKAVTTFMNATVILDSSLTPQQRSDETDLAWQYSELNATVPNGRYPDWMLKGGFNFNSPALGFNVNGLLSLMGPRRATLVNRQLYNYLDLDRTYTLPVYLAGWLTVSTLGWRPLGSALPDETVVSLSARYIPGGATEPGYGGVDIPSSGPSVFLRLEQRL